MSDDLKTLFENSAVPAARSDLSDCIMAHASTLKPLHAANDRKPWIWTAAAGIAATLMAGFFVMNMQSSESELWAKQAETAGFGDLYSWVDGETQ